MKRLVQNKDGIGASHQTGQLTNDKRITSFNFTVSSDIKQIIFFTRRQQSPSALVDFIIYIFVLLPAFVTEKRCTFAFVHQ